MEEMKDKKFEADDHEEEEEEEHEFSFMEELKEYSEYSTIAGLIYIFMPGQTLIGKLFWTIVIISMLSLGTYWTAVIYTEWYNQPTITTATTTAEPVSKIPFPSLTICPRGINQIVFRAGIYKLIFDHSNLYDQLVVSNIGGNVKYLTPYLASALDRKSKLSSSDLSGEIGWSQYLQLQDIVDQIWAGFLDATFPGLDPTVVKSIDDLTDLLLLYAYDDPNGALLSIAMRDYMKKSSNDILIDLLTPDSIDELNSTISILKEKMLTTLEPLSSSKTMKGLFSTLWYSRLPCADKVGITAQVDGDSSALKSCHWKGELINCSQIFVAIPTDHGMCCAFNMLKADEIFYKSSYTELVTENQVEDKKLATDQEPLPADYVENQEPKTQPGTTMGLTVMFDLHSDIIDPFTVETDYNSMSVMIKFAGEMPINSQQVFKISPGVRNTIALSATKVEADSSIRDIKPWHRQCYYKDELEAVSIHKSYSIRNCYLECAMGLAMERMESKHGKSCTPWYVAPMKSETKICNPWEASEIRGYLQDAQLQKLCGHCLPECNHVILDYWTATENFRQCNEKNLGATYLCNLDYRANLPKPQIWGTQVLAQYTQADGTLDPTMAPYLTEVRSSIRDIKGEAGFQTNRIFTSPPEQYEAYKRDIGVANIYFDIPTTLVFGTAAAQTWVTFFANVGGLLGLCIGLSIITIIEIAWFGFQVTEKKVESDKKKNRKMPSKNAKSPESDNA